MTTLISKLQYKNFETGEFSGEKPRNYEEVIALIERFPWRSERGGVSIGLTNSSLTIEGKYNDYLKLTLYFNGKFILYYLDQKQALYTKSFTQVTDSYKYIKDFFDSFQFDLTDFKKENTIFQNNLKHFISQNFIYEVTAKSAFRFLYATSGMNLLFSVFIICAAIFGKKAEINAIAIIVILLVIFALGGGLNLILFFQYYSYSKDKILIISKGNDQFVFGDKISPSIYKKSDIAQFTISRVRNSKHTISSFALVTIELKDGTELKIPNIIVDHSALEYKLTGIPKIESGSYPSFRA